MQSQLHTCTKITNKSCKVVIEHASCINIVSSKVTDKVGLTIVTHPQSKYPRSITSFKRSSRDAQSLYISIHTRSMSNAMLPPCVWVMFLVDHGYATMTCFMTIYQIRIDFVTKERKLHYFPLSPSLVINRAEAQHTHYVQRSQYDQTRDISNEVENYTVIPNSNVRRELNEISNQISHASYVVSCDIVPRDHHISSDNLNTPESIPKIKEFSEYLHEDLLNEQLSLCHSQHTQILISKAPPSSYLTRILIEGHKLLLSHAYLGTTSPSIPIDPYLQFFLSWPSFSNFPC